MSCIHPKSFADHFETDETWGLGTMKNSAGTLQRNPHNLLKSSEDFASSDWTKTDTTVTSNAAMAPDGTLTADKISHTSTNAAIYQNAPASDGSHGAGILVKSVDHQWFRLYTDGGSAWFDIQNGVVGTYTTDTATILDMGDGWYYLAVEDVTASTVTFSVYLSDADNSAAESSGTSAYIWGAHLYRNDLGGMAKVPTSDRALAALEYYVPNKAVVTGSNLVSNGTFDSSTAGWTLSASTPPTWASGGYLQLNSDGVTFSSADQSFTTVVGSHYRLSIDAVTMGEVVEVRVGTAQGGAHNVSGTLGASAYIGTHTFYFTATATTTWLRFRDGSGIYAQQLDNITVEEVDRNPSAARYLPRRENHEYINGSWVKGMLVEPDGATNLITTSDDFDQIKVGVTITSDNSVGLDGLVSADRMSGDGASNSHYTSTSTITTAIGDYSYSVHLKYVDTQWIQLTHNSSIECYANFDVQNGIVGDTGANAADATMEYVGNGWYRCSVTMTTIGNASTAVALVASGTDTWLLSNTASTSVDMWGWQFEAGYAPTSYIPTSGSAVARGAETTTIPASVMDSLGLFNTVAVDGTELVTNGTFDTDTSGWTGRNGNTVLSPSGGMMQVEASAADVAYAYQQITAAAGSVCRLTLDYEQVQNVSRVYVGIGAGTNSYYDSGDLSGKGSLDIVFVATSANPVISLYASLSATLGDASRYDNISVKEIHRRGIGVQMHGYMSYGDDGDFNTIIFAEWNADASNYLRLNLGTNSTETGEVNSRMEAGGTQDTVTSATDAYSPGVMVPFKIASRFLDNALQGAADGVATTENTTPVGLPDLTGVDLEVAYSGPALHITDFIPYAENQPANDGNFKMDESWVKRKSL